MHPGAMLQSIYSTKGQTLSAWVRGTVCLLNRCCQIPAASRLPYCTVDFGSMKRPQANLNIHIIRDSPKAVAVGGVLWLLCTSRGGTEGLAGTDCCSSLFWFPGLTPFLMPTREVVKKGSSQLHLFPLQAGLETHLQVREALLQSALPPKATGQGVFSGQADTWLPTLVFATFISAGYCSKPVGSQS